MGATEDAAARRVIAFQKPQDIAWRGTAPGAATLAGVKRLVADMNPTLRGFILIAAVSGAIVALQAESVLVQLSVLLQILFLIAVAVFVYTFWRERRGEIELWPLRARSAFYGAAGLILADIGAYWWDRPTGPSALAFFLVLGTCGFTMFRVWRDQHTYS
jgi:hypothetical protein